MNTIEAAEWFRVELMTAEGKAYCPVCLDEPQRVSVVRVTEGGGEEGLCVCSEGCAIRFVQHGFRAFLGMRWLSEGPVSAP